MAPLQRYQAFFQAVLSFLNFGDFFALSTHPSSHLHTLVYKHSLDTRLSNTALYKVSTDNTISIYWQSSRSRSIGCRTFWGADRLSPKSHSTTLLQSTIVMQDEASINMMNRPWLVFFFRRLCLVYLSWGWYRYNWHNSNQMNAKNPGPMSWHGWSAMLSCQNELYICTALQLLEPHNWQNHSLSLLYHTTFFAQYFTANWLKCLSISFVHLYIACHLFNLDIVEKFTV